MVYKGKLSSLSDGVPSTAPVAVKAFKGRIHRENGILEKFMINSHVAHTHTHTQN